MLNLKNVSKSFDGKVVLNDVSFSLQQGQIVGLVGDNGAGKSTVLKLLNGELLPDTGMVAYSGEFIGYLPQTYNFGDLTVEAFLYSGIEDSSYAYRIPMTLEIVGLQDLKLNQICSTLSGGQKTKLYLASILLADPEPTVLLLDEPTNNLDLDGLVWLENFVKNFTGSIVLTSHDRFFLDNTVTKIVEIKDGALNTYGGNYSFYKEQKLIEEKALERRYEDQQKSIKKIEENIREYKQKAIEGETTYTSRNPYQKKKAGKAARTAIVRERKLEKMLESSEHIEKPNLKKSYGVTISSEMHSGKLVLDAVDCGMQFNNNFIFQHVSFDIRGPERVWLVGKNGSGKSTLIKIVLGLQKQTLGSVRLGDGISVGYFSQDSHLDLNRTGIDILKNPNIDLTTCYIEADHLHLSHADLNKPLKQLSRGQIAKIEFLRLILQNNDLLILDEPTNHLEIDTREDIEKALQNYTGAILVASHDRYFIDKLGISKVIQLV